MTAMQVENEALFNISKLEHQVGSISAVLDINRDCEIFKGHFPGQPIAPGACMLQIVKDILEKATSSHAPQYNQLWYLHQPIFFGLPLGLVL
jgi:3-hydroxymyristoyl/3-hydroxydecanoyl-(acyl carrier protein) dehydratase